MKDAALAIDLGGTNIKGAVVDREGAILYSQSVPTGSDLSPAAVIECLGRVIESLRNKAENEFGRKVVGAGIGCPGGIYRNRAVVSQSPNFPGWRDVNLRAGLEQRVRLPATIENDANLAALGEFYFGAGREVDSMILFTLGTGIGGGVILDGRIWQGAWGMAGEVGHITVEPDGPLCGCGNHGCLEALASGPAMVKQAKEAASLGAAPALVELMRGDLEALTPLKIYEAAKLGDELSLTILKRAGVNIGIVIASLLNALNVPLFVIGGGIGEAFDVMGPYIRDEVRARAYRVPGSLVRIEKAILGNDAGTIGAAMLAYQEFGSPSEREQS